MHPVRRSARGPRVSFSWALAVLALAACGDSATAPLDVEPLEARKVNLAIEVVSPVEGEVLSGTETFRARLHGGDASHKVTWQVDWGQTSPLSPAADGDGYTADVDVSSWTWSGEGPYALTFRGWDKRGRRVAEAVLSVRVAQSDTTSGSGDDGGSDGGSGGDGSTNPLAGHQLWIDPYSNARKQADEWAATRPEDAAMMERIAENSQADWFGDWNKDVRASVDARTTTIVGAGGLPVFVAYNLPLRDCNSYSAGGAPSPDAYRTWIRDFASGLAGRKAAVILEPDGLAQLGCLTAADQEVRLELLRDAVGVLAGAGAVVYLDAGHPRWHSAEVMAERLIAAGIAGARGFSINVSNFVSDSDNVNYGQKLSGLLSGAAFVVDTSRNGLGPAADGEWCNPDGRALGTLPVLGTAVAALDAYVWIKRPGESDGTCNGGPSAGSWWADYALGLAQRAPAYATLVASGG